MSSLKEVYMLSTNGQVYKTNNPDYWKECEKLPMVKGKALYKNQIKKSLLEIVIPSQTIFCIIRKVSASGMQRQISLLVIDNDSLRDITYSASIVMDWKQGNTGGLIVNGCGMDMAFHTVYTLARILFREMENTDKKDSGYFLKSEVI